MTSALNGLPLLTLLVAIPMSVSRSGFLTLAVGVLTGMLWVSWPKNKKMGTDLALPKVIEIGYKHGLVESKTLSVDDTRQVLVQVVGAGVTIAWCGVMTFVLLKVIGAVTPLHADASEESEGLDMTQHGEEAYVHVSGSASL